MAHGRAQANAELSEAPAPDHPEEEVAMPAKTKRQQRFMAMCLTPKGRKKARGKCPPKKVAREFRRGPGKPK